MIESIRKAIRHAHPNMPQLEVEELAEDIFRQLLRDGYALAHYREL